MDEKNSILIIDDDSIAIAALAQILSIDYIVHVEKDGSRAAGLAKSLMPDLILLDVVMPKMDGFAVMSALKSAEETREIPVIFVTGLSNAADEEKGLAMGAADYIQKPFTAPIVKLRVRNQLQILNQMRIIRSLSITDALTNIANRRYFNDRLQVEWNRAMREKVPLSIFMLDVDHFKSYNDSYGHLQGDMVLRGVADIIKARLFRPHDIAARWGGEEFAVLLPSTHIQGACIVADDIRVKIEKHAFPWEGTSTYLTVSAGVNCVVPAKQNDIDLFVYDADKALYRAKNSGKNKVVMARSVVT